MGPTPKFTSNSKWVHGWGCLRLEMEYVLCNRQEEHLHTKKEKESRGRRHDKKRVGLVAWPTTRDCSRSHLHPVEIKTRRSRIRAGSNSHPMRSLAECTHFYVDYSYNILQVIKPSNDAYTTLSAAIMFLF